MAMFYTFMNALAIALLALFTLAVHMLVRLRNLYFAVLVPFILMYACNYANAILCSNNLQYNLKFLLQPRAASSFRLPFTWGAVGTIFGVLIVVDLLGLAAGILRNRESV